MQSFGLGNVMWTRTSRSAVLGRRFVRVRSRKPVGAEHRVGCSWVDPGSRAVAVPAMLLSLDPAAHSRRAREPAAGKLDGLQLVADCSAQERLQRRACVLAQASVRSSDEKWTRALIENALGSNVRERLPVSSVGRHALRVQRTQTTYLPLK